MHYLQTTNSFYQHLLLVRTIMLASHNKPADYSINLKHKLLNWLWTNSRSRLHFILGWCILKLFKGSWPDKFSPKSQSIVTSTVVVGGLLDIIHLYHRISSKWLDINLTLSGSCSSWNEGAQFYSDLPYSTQVITHITTVNIEALRILLCWHWLFPVSLSKNGFKAIAIRCLRSSGYWVATNPHLKENIFWLSPVSTTSHHQGSGWYWILAK